MWPVTLSGRLPIVDLVSRYLTNYLIGREPIPLQINLCHNDHATSVVYAVLAFVSKRYPAQGGRLLTRYSPVRH